MTEYILISEAAKRANVSARHVRRWVAAGRLPVRSGRNGRLVDLEATLGLAGLQEADAVGHADIEPETSALVEPGPVETVVPLRAMEMLNELWKERNGLVEKNAELQRRVEELEAAAAVIGRPWWRFWGNRSL